MQFTTNESNDSREPDVDPPWHDFGFVMGREGNMPIAARLSEYAPTKTEWLWPGRVPLGALTLLVGDPGLGKSYLTLDLAARVTSALPLPLVDGEPRPEAPAQPGSVVLLSAEDNPCETIRPRFEALGGDPKRLMLLRAVSTWDNTDRHQVRSFLLGRDLDALERVIKADRDCRLVILDPITAYLGNSGCNNAHVREMLLPLARVAMQRRVAVLAVNHLTKQERGPLLNRAAGSIALGAAARSVLVVFPHPYEPQWKIVAPIKSNMGETPGALRYRIGQQDADRPVTVIWKTGPIGERAESLIAAGTKTKVDRPGAAEAEEWLRAMLASGSQPAAELKRLAKADGIHERTLLRAKAKLELVTRRAGFGAEGVWLWSLPEYGFELGEWVDEEGAE